jgi:hypothetical protein
VAQIAYILTLKVLLSYISYRQNVFNYIWPKNTMLARVSTDSLDVKIKSIDTVKGWQQGGLQ